MAASAASLEARPPILRPSIRVTGTRPNLPEATVQAVQPYQLHGTLYYQFILLFDGEARPRDARLSHDMAYPEPAAGDRVDVHSILGIIDGVRRLEV